VPILTFSKFIMPSLELKLEDRDAHDNSIQDLPDEVLGKSQAEYQTFVESAVKSILEIVPDAPLSTEIALVGDIILEIAQQIPSPSVV
jgi:hypothetical protein